MVFAAAVRSQFSEKCSKKRALTAMCELGLTDPACNRLDLVRMAVSLLLASDWGMYGRHYNTAQAKKDHTDTAQPTHGAQLNSP